MLSYNGTDFIISLFWSPQASWDTDQPRDRNFYLIYVVVSACNLFEPFQNADESICVKIWKVLGGRNVVCVKIYQKFVGAI